MLPKIWADLCENKDDELSEPNFTLSGLKWQIGVCVWQLCPPPSSIFLHPPKCAYFRPPNSILEREAEPEKHKPKCPQISVTSNKYIHQTTVCWHPFSPFQQTGSILSSNGANIGAKESRFYFILPEILSQFALCQA